MTTKITLTNIDSTGDYSELVDSAYSTANAAFAKANTSVSAAAIIYFPDSIVSNTTFSANTNGLSVGPITIPSGISVTLPTGQRWVIL